MGHLVGKDLYKQLGKKIDGSTVRTPWNENLYRILKELYSEEEALLVVKMPFSPSNIDQIIKATKYDLKYLEKILENLCQKGLVIDFWVEEQFWYMPSPLLVGIFEMTMMRTGPGADYKKWARLFHGYMGDKDVFPAENFGNSERSSFIRTLVHQEALDQSEYVEVLDYEKAEGIVEQAQQFAIGYCSCRHEKQHLGTKTCSVPLETCSSFGKVAEYLVRRGMAKKVSRSEMIENIHRSKEMMLVLTADNIKNEPTFICHCCKCCCGVLLGVTKHGYPNFIVTSNYVAHPNPNECSGCELCLSNCPVNAVKMIDSGGKRPKTARVDESLCIGCGVCGLVCKKGAIKLIKRSKRVIQPETTFERVILQSLERGTLQNQLFDNPGSISHKFMRGILGGFFHLKPVQRALMSEQLRSTFLSSMKYGAKLQGRELITRI